MNKQVEILKIAYTAGPINDRMFIVVSNAGPVYDYYVSLLMAKYPDNKFYKTTKNVVGSPFGRLYTDKKLIGVPDGDPIVGQSYTINDSSWNTSRVQCVIEDCVLVTLNSVYAIHDISEVRDKKLKDLLNE